MLNPLVPIKDDIQIQWPGPPSLARRQIPTGRLLNLFEIVQKLEGREIRLGQERRVDEGGLVGDVHGGGLI